MLVPDRCTTADPAAEPAPDRLTRLHCRAAFLDLLGGALERARRQGRPLSLLAVTLHGVSAVRVQHGPFAADHVLALLAHRLRCAVRPEDPVGRLEPATCAVLLLGRDDRLGFSPLRQQAREALGQPFKVGLSWLRVPIGLGLASYPRDGLDGHTLWASARLAAAIDRPA